MSSVTWRSFCPGEEELSTTCHCSMFLGMHRFPHISLAILCYKEAYSTQGLLLTSYVGKPYIIDYRYNPVGYTRILNRIQKDESYSFVQTMNSQITPHTLPLCASYGASILRSLEKKYREISKGFCGTYLFHSHLLHIHRYRCSCNIQGHLRKHHHSDRADFHTHLILKSIHPWSDMNKLGYESNYASAFYRVCWLAKATPTQGNVNFCWDFQLEFVLCIFIHQIYPWCCCSNRKQMHD